MSIQKTMRMKKIESCFIFVFVGQRLFQTQQAIQTCRRLNNPNLLTFFNNLMCC